MEYNDMKSVDFVVNKIIGAVKNKQGFSLIRTNDGEKEVLYREIFKYKDIWKYPYKGMCDVSYIFIEEKCYEQVFNELKKSILNADFVGYSNNYIMIDSYIKAGLKYPMDNGCYVWINHHLPARKRFIEKVICNNKIALIGNMLGTYNEIKKINNNCEWFKDVMVVKNYDDLAVIEKYLQSIDYDIILVSLGVWAKILCNNVKNLGKIAIDWGSTTDFHWEEKYLFNTKYNNLSDYYNQYNGLLNILENEYVPKEAVEKYLIAGNVFD
jgi:hypothetical protein